MAAAQHHAIATQEEHSRTYAVEGIHCASCIRLIENALTQHPSVTCARVNFSTKRLSLVWKGLEQAEQGLIESVTRLGYTLKPVADDTAAATQKTQEHFLLRCIAVSAFATANLMLLAEPLWAELGADDMGEATKSLFRWLSALIALPAVFYAGRPFYRSAWAVLRHGRTNMDVPISLAVVLSAAMSLFETIRGGEHIYFDSSVMLLFFLLIGRYLDVRAKGKARESAANLLKGLSGTAQVLQEDGHTRTVPLRDLTPGLVVRVAMGENIPADGTVLSGVSSVDKSLLTGETLPEKVEPGGTVFAGTLNLDAPLTIQVGKASEDSVLSEIVRLLETAEQGQAKYVRLADRAAQLYTPVVHAVAALTLIGWLVFTTAPWQTALLHSIAVLIITCPCALGLAVPVVQVLASSRLMKAGILLKSGDALERLAGIDTVVFDKTGTLTLGQPSLQEGYPADALPLAAALAAHSKHPLAQALARAHPAPETILLENIQEIPAYGLEALYNGKRVRLGKRAWCGDINAAETDTPELWLHVDGQSPGRFAFTDALRPDAPATIRALQNAGITVHLLSGDRPSVAEALASALHISHVRAAALPADKCQYLENLKAQGRKILMVGDGLNDAPALAAATVSMSPASALDITQNTAAIVFQGASLSPVLQTWQTARRAGMLVRQNLAMALLYNLIAIPVAVLGYVTPFLAAVAMSSSSLLVIGNAFRLGKRSRP